MAFAMADLDHHEGLALAPELELEVDQQEAALEHGIKTVLMHRIRNLALVLSTIGTISHQPYKRSMPLI